MSTWVQVELNFFGKSVELNWEVELKNSSRIEKLDSIIQLENSTQLSAQKHRHYIDTVHDQNWKNCNIRVFEKYSNYDEKMTIRNERVEREEYEETKKNESTMTRIEKKRLYAQTIDVIDQREDIKQRLWSDYM